MADRQPEKYRVIGERAVSGIAPGGTYIDDGTLNVRALVKARHLELIPVAETDDKPTPPRRRRGGSQ